MKGRLMTDRDPSVDHEHELHPATYDVEDRSDVVVEVPGEPPRQVVGENVDERGVAHFLRITEDGDICGGCEKDWPCEGRVSVEVIQLTPPAVDPELVKAVQEVLARRQA